MKRIFLISLLALATVVAGFAGVVWYEVSVPPSENRGEVVRIEVPRGMPFAVVAGRLENEGLVRHARPLRFYAAATRRDRAVHTGTYEFTIGERPRDILRRLAEGDILVVGVTIPEGYTQWEIARAFLPAAIDSTAMQEAIHDPEVIERRHIPVPSLEGYLFPDTYRVPYGASAEDVVAQMLSRLDELFDAELVARMSELELTPHEVLTLASIVEAEARVPAERPIIAAVYHNRLARGMRLEADPTVAYAMGGFRGRLLYRHLEVDSPYNTYRYPGLPPGPICSPGEASIRATLYPDPDTEALYFVARGDGSHVFSRTLAEHNAAVREARRARDPNGE